MALTLTIWWFAGVIGGISFATGIGSIVWALLTHHKWQIITGLLAILVGLGIMSSSLFSILRLIRGCA